MNQENCQQLSFPIFKFTQKRQNFPSLLFWTKQNHGCHKSGPFFAQQGEMARSIQLSVHYKLQLQTAVLFKQGVRKVHTVDSGYMVHVRTSQKWTI